MIKSWQHKGLRDFYLTGTKAGIVPEHAKRLKVILQLLYVASSAEKMDMPGLGFHPLKGKLNNFSSVTVNGNWRIIFRFEGKNAILVNYLDYH